MHDFKPIGLIRTMFDDPVGMPIQGGLRPDIGGRVEVFDEYALGLSGLDGFSHIILIYLFHRSNGYELMQKPFLDDQEKGVFAIRSPKRPNPIGLTVVGLQKIKDNILYVRGLDMLDETPLLDIKPYVPDFDMPKNAKNGWLKGKIGDESMSDERFSKPLEK